MNISLVGIDLAKNIFHLHGVDKDGRAVFKKRLYRSELLPTLRSLPNCRVAMEACGGSNYWCREIKALGHEVQLIAPQYVRPYVQRNKTDTKDAEAICTAARQPHMRYVPQRSVAQQDLQNLHRIRERLVKSRTALVNETRGLLAEYGIVIAKGRRVFAKQIATTLFENRARLTTLAQTTFSELVAEYHALDERIKLHEKKLELICRAHPVCARLKAMPGVGYLTATAVVAAVSDAQTFKNGREFAAWLGLTPREFSTGGKQRLLGISKRGDVYIRKLLVHGARITLRYLKHHDDRLSAWAKDLLKRKGTNRTAVALANKNARIIWNLIAKDEEYKTFPLAA